MNYSTLSEVSEALKEISPDIVRDEWVEVGMALQSEFGDAAYEVWDQWSQGGETYNQKDAKTTWNSFGKRNGGITIKTLFQKARKGGYKGVKDGNRATSKAQHSQSKTKPSQAGSASPDKEERIKQNQAQWDAATDIEEDFAHPYLSRKAVKAYGLRVDANNNLLMPLINQRRKIVAYQRIDADGNPKASTGGLFGGFFLHGDPGAAGTVLVAEGYATGATVSQISQQPFAVACGADNLMSAGMSLRMMYPKAKIIFLADDDFAKETNTGVVKAEKAADEVDGLVALPLFSKARESNHTDFNDLYVLEGEQAVIDSLANAKEPECSLIDTYEYDPDVMVPVEYVIDGFIATGITLIAGSPGLGKTTAMVTMAAMAAGLIEQESTSESEAIKVTLRRKVYYVTEDAPQVDRILFGLKKHGIIQKSAAEIKDWIEIVKAKRMPAADISKMVSRMIQKGTRKAAPSLNGYKCRPLMVLDTSNATIDLDNENDNSETGRAIAYIKQNLNGSPLWLAGHTAKSIKHADVRNLSFRGAGAFEGDANAVTFLFRESDDDTDDGVRFWALGKHRFESEFKEVRITTEAKCETVQTPWGIPQHCWYRIAVPARSSVQERKEEKAKQKAEANEVLAKERDREVREKIFKRLQSVESANKKITKTDLKASCGVKTATALATIEAMLDTGHLVGVMEGKATYVRTKEYHEKILAAEATGEEEQS
jgi:Primase C terminal 2 (PriCT-2)/AAA domain/Toprim domain